MGVCRESVCTLQEPRAEIKFVSSIFLRRVATLKHTTTFGMEMHKRAQKSFLGIENNRQSVQDKIAG